MCNYIHKIMNISKLFPWSEYRAYVVPIHEYKNLTLMYLLNIKNIFAEILYIVEKMKNETLTKNLIQENIGKSCTCIEDKVQMTHPQELQPHRILPEPHSP